MVGGVFVYLIAKKIASPNAALFSVFFYLFVPYSILPSRAFMPDPLMVMSFVIAIFTIVRYHEQPQSRRRLIVAAAASSLAVFVKPGICFFQIFAAFVALSVYRQGIKRSLFSWHMVVFAVLSALPTALYYLYGTFGAGFLQGQAQAKIVPEYMLEVYFWTGWLHQTGTVVGYVALTGALFGVLLLRSALPKALIIGLWTGYFLFGLVFTYHIHTQDYYSLQLIPVVALSLCPVVELVMKYLGRVGLRSFAGPIIVTLSVSVLIVGAVEHRQTISKIAEQDHAASVYARRVAAYEEIGRNANHSQRALCMKLHRGLVDAVEPEAEGCDEHNAEDQQS
jgi:4-amino-4-deoxy-L-arabinose transferase-like glycosyltransferase